MYVKQNSSSLTRDMYAAADTGVSPDGVGVGGVVGGGGGGSSVLEAIDQVLRQERRRWPAAAGPHVANDDCGMGGVLHGGLLHGGSAEDRSMALIASTFPDSPISSEEDEEPPAMPLLPDMPRRRRIHMMQQVVLSLLGTGRDRSLSPAHAPRHAFWLPSSHT